MTLKKFIELAGGQEKAAQKLGVSWRTVHRWVRGYSQPSGLARKALEALGVEI